MVKLITPRQVEEIEYDSMSDREKKIFDAGEKTGFNSGSIVTIVILALITIIFCIVKYGSF